MYGKIHVLKIFLLNFTSIAPNSRARKGWSMEEFEGGGGECRVGNIFFPATIDCLDFVYG